MPSISSSILCIVLSLAWAGAACEQPDEFRLGLPAVYLDIDSEDIAKLRAGTYSKGKVLVRLRRGSVQEACTMAVAGHSSVDDLRRSYTLALEEGKLRLDATSRDPSMLRARLAYEVYLHAGFVMPEPSYVTVFVNGSYHGLYSEHGLVDEAFSQRFLGEALGIYQATHSLGTLDSAAFLSRAFDARPGNYEDLRAMVTTLHGDPDLLAVHVDLDAVARYMAATLFTDNGDGIDNNYLLLRIEGDLRFTILPWDMDYSFRTARSDPRTYFQRNALMLHIYNRPALRERFCQLLLELGAVFSEGAVQEILEGHIADIELAHRSDPVLGVFSDTLTSAKEQVLAYRRSLHLDHCAADSRAE